MLTDHAFRNFTHIILLAFAAAFGLPASAESANDSEDSHAITYLNTALASARGGDGASALELLRQQDDGALCPRHRAEHFGVACRAHLAAGDPGAARAACAQAIELHNVRGNWRYYNNLGIAEYQLGNTAAAVKALETAVLQSRVVSTPRKNLEIVRSAVEHRTPKQQVASRLQLR